MTKIAIVGDIHVGARNSNKMVEKWQNKFFDNLFFPYLKEHGIKTVFQMGDFFDNRKWMNVQSVDNMIDHIVTPTQELGLHWHVLIGNHDIPLKHTLKGHTPGILLNHYPEFNIYDEVTPIEVDDRTFTFMPWMCKDNFEQSMETVRNGGDILLGHFEVSGALMHPGAFCHDGTSAGDFKAWRKVWSGHFHSQSENGNIHYLGTPYQMCWSDASTKHGFWIYDTNEDTMEFVENPYRYFHRLYWNDGCDYDLSNVADGYVKLTVNQKTDFEKFEKFVDQINFNTPFELKIIETFEEWNQENVQDLINVSTTEDLIKEYIEDVTTDNSSGNVTKFMIEIYKEALNIED